MAAVGVVYLTMNAMEAVSMLISFVLSLGVPIVVVVLVVRAISGRNQGRSGDGHGVRRFFQYLLLLGLVVVTLVGAITIASLVLDPPLAGGDSALARGLTLTLLGGALLTAIGLWTRSLMRSDPREIEAFGWAVYLTLADLVLALITAIYLAVTVTTALRHGAIEWQNVAAALLAGAAWGTHWLLMSRTMDESRSGAAMAIGSAIGWVLGLSGLIGMLSAALRLVLGQPELVGDVPSQFADAAGPLIAGATLWLPHWSRRLSKATPGVLWTVYVLVLGVGASLVVTVSGASVTVYRLLVWLLGDPGSLEPGVYLADTATALAALAVGGLSWWYHRTVLNTRAEPQRTETTRAHEYLLAGIALMTAATGLVLVVVALVDAVAPASLVAGAVINSVLAAITLLGVGGPLWWLFWRRAQHARVLNPPAELSSPTRRIYVMLLFGVAGVVAVVVLLIAVYVVLDDLIGSSLGWNTLRDVRVPVGMLLAAGAISGYHAMIQRADRAETPTTRPRPTLRLVVLVGPVDDVLVQAIARATGARVDPWPVEGSAWDHTAVLDAVASVDAVRVMLLQTPQGMQVIAPVPQSPDAPISS